MWCIKPFLTPEELLRVLRVARSMRIRDWCMILMAYWHGLRMSEVCTLKLSDISDGSLSVQRRQGSLKTVQPLCRDSEPLLDEVAAIQAWLKERPNVHSDALFISRNGYALDKIQFFKNFQSIAKAALIPSAKRRPGILRYSLASHLAARNVNRNDIASAMGYSSINSTFKFIKGADPRIQRANSFAVVMQETRLKILLLLVRHAPKALPAGTIARHLRMRGPSLSFHLGVLASAELIQPHRKGTSISYSANVKNVSRMPSSVI
jgi:type 1 fimbriae regulatory protein FimB